jgi:hypothetical protein
MKRSLAATVLLAGMVLAGCSDREPAAPAAGADEVASAANVPATTVPPAGTPAAARPSAAAGEAAAVPAAVGAPDFAVIYPGGTPKGPATTAQGPEGPGGLVRFTTEAEPETVIAFYRQRAEAAGLKPINSMKRGNAQAYSAGDGADGRGQLMQVIAERIEGGSTDVQLDWTAGR